MCWWNTRREKKKKKSLLNNLTKYKTTSILDNLTKKKIVALGGISNTNAKKLKLLKIYSHKNDLNYYLLGIKL